MPEEPFQNLAARLSDEKYQKTPEFSRTSKQYLLAQIPRGEALSILDVGCGTGLNSRTLAAQGHAVVGVDISAVAVDKYRQAGFDGRQADITRGLPFADRSFDLVFASEVIEHLADSELFLAECRRVLKPGGALALSTPNSAFWAFRVLAILGRTASEVQHPGHLRFFSARGLGRLIQAAGFAEPQLMGRHIYLILAGGLAERCGPWLERIGFKREFRFKTGKWFWHLSRFSSRAGSWWADTLIVMVRRPRA